MTLSRICLRSVFVAAFLWTSAWAAVEPADDQIRYTFADLHRYEQQAAGLTAAGQRNATRILKLMRITRQRLDSSPNRTHESWIEADKRFAALQRQLQAAAAGKPAGSAPIRDAAAASGGATNSRAANTPAAADSAASGASDARRELVSGQRVQLKKLARDISNAKQTLVTQGPSPMQDGRVVAKYNKALKKYAGALTRYKEYAQDPDIAAAMNAYQAFVAAIKAEYARSRDQLAVVGDAQARLAALHEKLKASQPPGRLLLPFDDAQATAWAGQLKTAHATARAVSQEIQTLLPQAYLPTDATYSPQRVNSLLRGAQASAQKGKDAVAATEAQLKDSFAFADKHELPYFRDLDPADEHQKANMFLQEGAEAGVYERLDKQRELANSYAAFYRGFGKQPSPLILARIEEVAQLRARYAANRVKAIGESTLPAPKSTDPAQLAIAREILANPEYKFGKHGPIVLTTDAIVTREKEVSRDTIKDVDVSLSGTISLSGTRETWHYKWDEFRFATPLLHDDGQWYIWWITAKKYEAGWEGTPIGRWVSGRTTQGSLIPEKNF